VSALEKMRILVVGSAMFLFIKKLRFILKYFIKFPNTMYTRELYN